MRVDEEVYGRIIAEQRPRESMSATLRRLLGIEREGAKEQPRKRQAS